MKRYFVILTTALGATLFCMPHASAFPGERMPYRAVHFAGHIVHKVDRQVIHPVVRGIANHTPHR